MAASISVFTGIFRRNLTCYLNKNLNNISVRNFSSTKYSCSPIRQAYVDEKSETIKVKFSNGSLEEYPWIFLQDNCTCQACFHTPSQSRLKLMTNLKLDKKITTIQVTPERNGVTVEWEDGHRGEFSKEWLLERSFDDSNRRIRTKILRDEPILFEADYKIQRDDFQIVLGNQERLVNLLETLCQNGVFILEAAPTIVGQVRKLVERIGFIRTTHYGNEFTVKSERNASNIAYTSSTLCVHTDLPYYVYPPCVQLLHCIKQYEGTEEDAGGESHLVDGFQVAHQMKLEFPESYDVLSNTPVEFADIGEDFTKFHKVHHSPTFVHSQSSGKLFRIVYSNQQLSSCLPVPMEQVKPVYAALKLFTDLCYDPKNLLRFRLKEGDMMIFDNWRILHGREGFDPSKGDRHLEGCYVDWDEVYSTIRVLKSRQHSHSHSH